MKTYGRLDKAIAVAKARQKTEKRPQVIYQHPITLKIMVRQLTKKKKRGWRKLATVIDGEVKVLREARVKP